MSVGKRGFQIQFFCVALAIGFVACVSPDIGEPGSDDNAFAAPSGPARRIGLACVATRKVGGTVMSWALTGTRLKKLFGDQLAMRGLADTLHTVLHVHHFNVGSGKETGDLLTCALPANSTMIEELRSLAANGKTGEWSNLGRDIEQFGQENVLHERGQMWTGSSQLRDLIAPNAKFVGRVRGGAKVNPVGGPLATAPEGYIPGSQPRPPQVIPEIFVTGTQYQWTIDFNFLWQTVRGHKSFSDLINWDYYLQGPICPPAEALWYAKNAQADSLEKEGEQVRVLGEAMGQAMGCVPVPGKPLCIDFFIMNERAMGFGMGDGRSFADTGVRSSSRVVAYLNPATGAREIKWSSSKVILAGVTPYIPFVIYHEIEVDDSANLYNEAEDFIVEPTASGWLRVKMSFRNNFCVNRSICWPPPIDAQTARC